MPAFNYSEQRVNTPIANMTTIFMQTAGSNATVGLVELLDFVLVGASRASSLLDRHRCCYLNICCHF